MNLPAIHSSAMPTNLEAAIRFAEIISTARTIPPAFRNSVGDCLLVTAQALQWGQNPAALMRECSVIANNLMISGKAIAAAVNTNAGLSAPLDYMFDGLGDDRMIIVSGKYPGEVEPRTIALTLKQARTNNAVWKNQPDQQLVYAGARVWARRHAPHVVMGVTAPEEAEITYAPPPPPAPPVPVAIEQMNPETGEVGPRALYEGEIPQDEMLGFCKNLIACVREVTDDAVVEGWVQANKSTLDQIEQSRLKMFKNIHHQINAHRAEIRDKARPARDNEPGSVLGAG